MAKATFDRCCCCIELKAGCFILGYMELIGMPFIFIQLYQTWKMLGSIPEALKKQVLLSEAEFEAMVQMFRVIAIGVIIFAVILFTLKSFFVIIYLMGLHKERRSYIGAFLIYNAIFYFIFLIFIIAMIVRFATWDETKIQLSMEMRIGTITHIIVLIMAFVLFAYFWMVIRSHYHNMAIDRPKSQSFPRGSRSKSDTFGPARPAFNYNNEYIRNTNKTGPSQASADARPNEPSSQNSNEGIPDTNGNGEPNNVTPSHGIAETGPEKSTSKQCIEGSLVISEKFPDSLDVALLQASAEAQIEVHASQDVIQDTLDTNETGASTIGSQVFDEAQPKPTSHHSDESLGTNGTGISSGGVASSPVSSHIQLKVPEPQRNEGSRRSESSVIYLTSPAFSDPERPATQLGNNSKKNVRENSGPSTIDNEIEGPEVRHNEKSSLGVYKTDYSERFVLMDTASSATKLAKSHDSNDDSAKSSFLMQAILTASNQNFGDDTDDNEI